MTETASTAPIDVSQRGRSRDWSRILSSRLMLPVILVVTVAVFAPTAQNWFWGDDMWLLRSAQRTPIGTFIIEAFDYRDREPVPAFSFYRPLYVTTFRLCYAAFGLNATAYHALNIALHLASVVLVWTIARRLLSSILAANVACLMFALHPAYTETVQGIARGNTVMVTLIYLLTLLAFMKYMDGGSRRALYYSAAVAGFAVAVLYHTTALSLVAVLPAYVFLVVRRPSEAFTLRSWLRFVPFVGIATMMLLIQRRDDVGLDRAFQTGWHQYAELGQYLGLAAFPVLRDDWLKLDLPRDSLLEKLSLGASLLMVAGTLVLLERRRWPYRSLFAAWWLFVAMLPNTTFLGAVIPAQLYLPGTALCLFFVFVVRSVGEMLSPDLIRRGTAFAPLFLAIVFACGLALTLSHLQQDDVFVRENRAFITRLRASVPSLPPGSTLYVVEPPFNLVAFGNAALEASVELYYGDVTVLPVSPREAARITSSDPTRQVFDNRSSGQP